MVSNISGSGILSKFLNGSRNIMKNVVAQSALKNTYSTLAGNVTNAWTGIDSRFGQITKDGLSKSGLGYISSIPVTPNYSVGTFFESVGQIGTDRSKTNLLLAEVTGINITNTFENLTSFDNVQDRVTETILSIERQVVFEIKDCLDSYLQELINKNPEIEILLDIEGAILKHIGTLRVGINLQIENEIEKILYDKIKFQQVAQLRQKLTEAIRKICPGHHSPPLVTRLSPTLTRQLQDDRSWTIVDGVNSISTNTLGVDAKLAHDAAKANSTAKRVQALSLEATSDIRATSLFQAEKTSTSMVSDYITADGDIK
jgi:hypothetical protein